MLSFLLVWKAATRRCTSGLAAAAAAVVLKVVRKRDICGAENWSVERDDEARNPQPNGRDVHNRGVTDWTNHSAGI